MTAAVFEDLVETGVVQAGVSLGSLTTYKLGGPARFFAEVDSVEQLPVLAAAWASDAQEILVVGRGSNLVISDRGWPGLAMSPGSTRRRVTVPSVGALMRR